MLKIYPSERFYNSTILVVDDVEFNLKLICSKLTASGYTNLQTALNGQEAVDATRNLKPDIVLLDLMMPVMDGYEYMDIIRHDPSIPMMPIIVQTALNDRTTKLKALSGGADDILNKPLDLDELALRVYIHLERFFILQDNHVIRDRLQAGEQGIAEKMPPIPQSNPIHYNLAGQANLSQTGATSY